MKDVRITDGDTWLSVKEHEAEALVARTAINRCSEPLGNCGQSAGVAETEVYHPIVPWRYIETALEEIRGQR